ncbi:ATP synthase F0F1 subunit A [Pseudoscardovia radai]|jgi:F-type H+-transporting ATPase subunit a|uniref:ATP synthase subunit a n=1 Tax=Pseudoscardovia radai TaxID=987066 RepID=A0A261F018_9BIFI|nr:F0F1 ATP synthase subunit A [Pseudoscardovia radai]OZG52425.1 ATP synthase F0F1 subunit A [Pseudoscardovia radai]
MTGSVGLSVLTAAGGLTLADGPSELPSIDDFLPPEILFQGTPFAMNRIILIRAIMTVVLLLVFGITAKRAKLIPGRWQGFVEWMIEFVEYNVVYSTMGELRGKRYVPMCCTIFFTALCFNLCGVIPGFNIAATATIAMPLMFALWTLVQYWRSGIRSNGGLGKYLKKELFPAGVPWPVYILLSPIKFLEIAVIQPGALTLRLFANMVSGHLTLATALVMTDWYIIQVHNAAMVPVGILWFLFGFLMTAFEIFIAALQAFIFSVLTAVYINSSYPEDE